MTMQEFLYELRERLRGLPERETRERLAFYGEMIDDRIEDGSSEAEAVASLGSVEKIAEQIISDIPLGGIVIERLKPKGRLSGWEIALLAVGSPLWLSLGIAAIAVLITLYAVIWSVIVSLWAVFASAVACGIYGVLAGGAYIIGGNALSGIGLIGGGAVCLGLSIFVFFGCKAGTSGSAVLTGRISLRIKRLFVNKEGQK